MKSSGCASRKASGSMLRACHVLPPLTLGIAMRMGLPCGEPPRIRPPVRAAAWQAATPRRTQLTLPRPAAALPLTLRNNHFNVLHKHGGQLYLLITDQARADSVWHA